MWYNMEFLEQPNKVIGHNYGLYRKVPDKEKGFFLRLMAEIFNFTDILT